VDPIVEYLWFLVIGGLCLSQLRRFGPLRYFTRKYGSLREFVECDLCLGSWFFMVLCLVLDFRINFTRADSLWARGVDVFLTGIVTAYVLAVVKAGLPELALQVNYGEEEIDHAEED